MKFYSEAVVGIVVGAVIFDFGYIDTHYCSIFEYAQREALTTSSGYISCIESVD
jgi:hypothetical protein